LLEACCRPRPRSPESQWCRSQIHRCPSQQIRRPKGGARIGADHPGHNPEGANISTSFEMDCRLLEQGLHRNSPRFPYPYELRLGHWENAIGKEMRAPVYTGMARPTETTGDSIPWSSSPLGTRPLTRNRERAMLVGSRI
jgi:hypothetical protein